jgi:rubrerythrin
MNSARPEILAALTAGIQSEVAAYVFYLESSKKVESADIRETLQQLAGEEKSHFHILERRYDALVRSEKWVSTADVLKREGLPELNEEMTELHKELIDKVRKMKSKKETLEMALRLETESRDLFAKSAGEAKSHEVRSVFERLARFEEGHIRLINSLIAEE